MKRQVLPIPLMQNLISLGVDTSGASMIYVDYDTHKRGIELEIYDKNRKYPRRTIPAFTLQDIIEKITGLISRANRHSFSITKYDTGHWNASLQYFVDDYRDSFTFQDKNPLIAAYHVLILVTEHKDRI